MISDIELIKKCMLKDVFNYRPHDWMFTALDKPTLVSWNGEEWKEQRKFAVRVFKQLGVGKTVVEEKIHEEIDYLFGQIEKQQKQLDTSKEGVVMYPLIGPSASNVVTLLVSGKRFDFDHPMRKVLDFMFLQRDVTQMLGTLGIVNYLVPFTRLMFLIPSTELKESVAKFECVKNYIRTQMEHYRKTFDPESDEPLNFRLYFTLGPVQDRLKNKLTNRFRGRRIHLSRSQMSEMCISGFTNFSIARLPV